MSRRFWFVVLPIVLTSAGAGAAWTLFAKGHPPGDPADVEQVTVGSALYAWNCARCHGEDLGGELGWAREEAGLSNEEIADLGDRLGDVAPAHDDSGKTARHPDSVLFDIIQNGPEQALQKPTSRMPAFADRLDEQEIWAIIAFMKSHWGGVGD